MPETQYVPVSPGVEDEGLPPLRSSRPAVDIPGFFDSVAQALVLYAKTEGVPVNTTPTFVHEFPKERLAIPDQPFDVITFKVAEASMAPTTNDGRAPRGPKVRETRPHEKLAGFNIQVYGWWELVQPQFIIWSKSSRNADLITDWFHKFIMRYAHVYKYFQARGAQNFRFVKRADDDVDMTFGQELYLRRLTYEFRLETLFGFEQKQLTDVDISYGVSSAHDTINIKPT